MKFLATILLVCLTLVSAGQAPIIKKVPRLQFTSQTAAPHGFHKLSANEGAEEQEEMEHEALPACDLGMPAYMMSTNASDQRNTDDQCRFDTSDTPLYLRVCRILI